MVAVAWVVVVGASVVVVDTDTSGGFGATVAEVGGRVVEAGGAVVVEGPETVVDGRVIDGRDADPPPELPHAEAILIKHRAATSRNVRCKSVIRTFCTGRVSGGNHSGRSVYLLVLWVGLGARFRGINQIVMAFQVKKPGPGVV